MEWNALSAGTVLLVSILCADAAGEPGPKTWEYAGEGKWPLVEQQPQAEPQAERAGANERLDRADRLLAQRRHGEARSLLLRWLRANPDAPDRDRALFLLGEAYYQRGDRIPSFYQFDQLLDEYPESHLYPAALERQFQIADRYLRGKKDRLFGLPILSRKDEAVEMLYRIQERAPGSPLAERALLRTADHYFEESQYDLAGDTYSAYLRSYPRSPVAPRVRLREAYSSYAQFRGLDFDATPLIDARAQFEDVLAQYPELAREENVRDVIDRIDSTLAAKLYHTADFYRRTRQPQAAAHLYEMILAQYPQTRDASRAQQALARLPDTARNAPKPVDPVAPPVGTEINIPGPDVR